MDTASPGTKVQEIDKETVSRKEILELYVKEDPKGIEDSELRQLVTDRQKKQQQLTGASEELKAYINSLQKKAAKLQADISDANGVIKYVDSRIVQRHIELTGVGK